MPGWSKRLQTTLDFVVITEGEESDAAGVSEESEPRLQSAATLEGPD
jgi:hypothetical protein